MKKNLAIITPQIGAPSETFIRRHIEDLYPGKTVVVTRKILRKNHGWPINYPVYIWNNFSFVERCQRFLAKHAPTDITNYLIPGGIKKFLISNEIKIVLGEFLSTSWEFIRISKALGVKFYGHAHGFDLSASFKDPIWQKRYKRYKEADGVIVVNNVMKDRLLSIGISSDKIHVIPYGINVPLEMPIRLENEIIRCLAVGRMVPKKAPLKLLEAFAKAVKEFPFLHLDYVGDGELFDETMHYIQSKDLSKEITLHDAQNHEFVIKLMRNANIFIQHSITDPKTGDEEGLPLAILEAMAMALPVVSTFHAGIPEAVLNNKTGFLVAEGDAAAMAKHIINLGRSKALRNEMGLAGWQRALHNYTWEKEKKNLLKAIGLAE
jgi:glycosyltransferase involved in cell wall biosynthesis